MMVSIPFFRNDTLAICYTSVCYIQITSHFSGCLLLQFTQIWKRWEGGWGRERTDTNKDGGREGRMDRGKNKRTKILCFPVYFILFYFIFIFAFRRLQVWHMEVPRLGVKLELQLAAYATATWIQAVSVTYTIAQSNASSFIHWVRPGIEPATSWILVRFVTHRATTGISQKNYLCSYVHLFIEIMAQYYRTSI